MLENLTSVLVGINVLESNIFVESKRRDRTPKLTTLDPKQAALEQHILAPLALVAWLEDPPTVHRGAAAQLLPYNGSNDNMLDMDEDENVMKKTRLTRHKRLSLYKFVMSDM